MKLVLCPQQRSILPPISPNSQASFHPLQLGAVSPFLAGS